MCTFRPSKYVLKAIHMHSWVFRGFSLLTQRHAGALDSIQGVFNTNSNALNSIQKVFNRIQGLFNSHTKVFFLMDHCELHSIITQWHSHTLNGCSCSLTGVHVHSMVFRDCSHSLIDIHAHSMGVQGLFTITQMHSCALNSIQGVFNTHSTAFSLFMYQRPNGYVFKYVKHAKAL